MQKLFVIELYGDRKGKGIRNITMFLIPYFLRLEGNVCDRCKIRQGIFNTVDC